MKKGGREIKEKRKSFKNKRGKNRFQNKVFLGGERDRHGKRKGNESKRRKEKY